MLAYDLYVRDGTLTGDAGWTLEGVEVKACALDDVESCSSPVATGTTEVEFEPISFDLPVGEDGFGSTGPKEPMPMACSGWRS